MAIEQPSDKAVKSHRASRVNIQVHHFTTLLILTAPVERLFFSCVLRKLQSRIKCSAA